MRNLICCLTILILSGCATYNPIIDTGESTGNWYQDLQECRAYAEQINTGENVAGSAIGGAAVGAAFGALVGAFFGADVGEVAGFGAASGALSGGIGGAAHSEAAKRDIVRRCMMGRGHKVLY